MKELNKLEKTKNSELEYLSSYYLFKMLLNGEGCSANLTTAGIVLDLLITRNASSSSGELSYIIGQCFQLLNKPAEALRHYNES